MNQQGLCYRAKGNFDIAITMFKNALSILEEIHKTESYNYLSIQSNLALVYIDKGKYLEAQDIYKHLLDLEKKIYGNDSEEVCISLNALGR